MPIDGAPTKSCLLKIKRLARKKVETIEGIRRNEKWRPIQAAFLASGVVQCGFCTPGMIMATKGLLQCHSDPTEDQIREALKGNICRCTGYVKIIGVMGSGVMGDPILLNPFPFTFANRDFYNCLKML